MRLTGSSVPPLSRTFFDFLHFRGHALFGLVGHLGSKFSFEYIAWNKKLFPGPNAGERSIVESGVEGIWREKAGMPP
jgi:hypothetical protein